MTRASSILVKYAGRYRQGRVVRTATLQERIKIIMFRLYRSEHYVTLISSQLDKVAR